MGNRKAKMLDTEMRVDSTADLQENSCNFTAPSNGDNRNVPSHANREFQGNRNRLRAGATNAGEQDSMSVSIRASKQFEAVNLDENGKFVQYGILEIAPSEIVFHRKPNKELVEKNCKASEEQNAKAKLLQPTNSLTIGAHGGTKGDSVNRRDVAAGASFIPSIHWPFYLLREYGYNQDLFIVETGRRACTGAGIFAFHTSNATELFRSLQEAIKQYSVKLKREEPPVRTCPGDHSNKRSEQSVESVADFSSWTRAIENTLTDAPNTLTGSIANESESTISPLLSSTYSCPFDPEQENLPKHNYVNLDKKLASGSANGSESHEYKTLAGDPTNANDQKVTAREDQEDRKYENLPRMDDQKLPDACYVNVTPPRDSTEQRDANGHLPGCPCHQKSETTKPKNKESASDNCVQPARQLNYIEVCPKKSAEASPHDVVVRTDSTDKTATSDSESSATLSQSTTQTTLASLTNAPSVFSLDANDGPSASRPPSRTSSGVFSANGKLAQTDTEYTKIDLERTEALKMSIKTFEDPRPSFAQELSRAKGSADSMTGHSALNARDKRANNDNLRLSPAALGFSNASPKVAKMLVIGMFKRSRRRILQIFS